MTRTILTCLVALAAALAAGNASALDAPTAARFTIDIGTSESLRTVDVRVADTSVLGAGAGTVRLVYQHNQTDLEFLRSWHDSGMRADAVLVVAGAATYRLERAWPSLAFSPQGPTSEGVVDVMFARSAAI